MGTARSRPAFSGSQLPVLIAFLSFALGGCSCPQAVQTYEYLSDYDRMVDQYEPLLSLVYVPEPTRLGDYGGVIVGPVDVGHEWVESRVEAISYATFFRIVLGKELRGIQKFQFVTLDARADVPAESLEGVLRLEGKITKFDMGSGLMRYLSYFLWFLQGGATDFQIEGRITEADSGRLLVEFADRRRHLGNTPFGPNPSNFHKGFPMNVTAKQTAECLASFIEAACEELPATTAGPPRVAPKANEL